MAKHCIEEFNPWPPFVDIFSSVILVLMLFLLIVVVNLGYYMQFNSQSDNPKKTVTKFTYDTQATKIVQILQNEVQALRDELKSRIKLEKQTELLQGAGTGNAIKRAKEDTFTGEQTLKEEGKDVSLIIFDDTEIFIEKNIRTQVIKKAKTLLRKNPDNRIVLSVADPKQVPGTSMAKRISLGRVLNIKALLKHAGIPGDKIKIKYRQKESSEYEFGYLKITAENKQ